jgi:hypothetical protein
MKSWAAAAAVALALSGLPASADEQGKPVLAVPESQLKLGPYAGFNLPRNEFIVPVLPHFETQVDVQGRTPNEAMFDWWQNFHFETSIYGRGINIQDTPGGAFNILPLFDWAKKKIKNKGMKEPDPEPTPVP